jgi:predicted TIM-barrel fold metal-dependent hydrolase
MTNIDDAIAELEHCARLGLKAVALNSFPSGQSFPTSEDDKFWAVAVDIRMPLTVHVQFGFPQRGAPPPPAPSFKYPKRPPADVPVPDMVDRFNKYGFRGSIHIAQLIWAGVFDRFPKLAIYIAEVQIGWIPNWVDQLDNEYGRQRFWVERVLGVPQLPRLPSEYVREHCYWGFNRNPAGVRIMRQEMGVDRVMWANDFPHLESDWPNSCKVIEECFAGVPDNERYEMIAGNAIRFFHLDGAERRREAATVKRIGV